MTPAVLLLGISVAGGLWPFGGDSGPAPGPTIGDLEPVELQLDETVSLPDSGARAREQYRLFLEVAGDQPALRVEALRRLADLSIAAGEEAAAQGRDEHQAYREALQLYARLLNENPGYPERDQVLYQVARAHESMGDAPAALARLDELVSAYPSSSLYDEAQFRRGEILFSAGRYAGAEIAYAGVVEAGVTSAFHEQALYKRGWSLFKQGSYEAAIPAFLDLLDARLASPGPAEPAMAAMSRPDRELVDDTLRVVALSLAYLEGAASLDAQLDRRPAPAYGELLYGGLGELYLDQERYTDAAETFAAFVQRAPVHAAAPGLQSRVIDAYAAGRFPARVLDAKETFVELFGLEAGYWQTRIPQEHPDVVAALKLNLSDLASHDHALAQAEADAAAYERAAAWYRRYLGYFPDEPDSAQRSLLLAEILDQLGRFGEAAEQYLDAAYAYGPHDRAAEAGYAALLAARAHEAQLAGAARASWHARTVEESLRFADRFPGHGQAGAVRTRVAEELFADGRLQPAIDVAGLVVTMQPPVESALERTAWTVMAHAYFDLENYAGAEQAYLRLKDLGSLDQDAARELETRIAASVYRQAEQRLAAGDPDGAVMAFLRVADAAPQAEAVPTALFDAAALLVRTEQWDRAVPVLERLRADYPSHELGDQVTQNLAIAQRAAGRPAEAAVEYERIATLASASVDVQREALWEAAELYRGATLPMAAARVYADIVSRFPEPVGEAIEARQHLADIAGEQGDAGARHRWLQDIVVADAGAGQARSVRTRTLAARASLELAAPLRDAFVSIALVEPLADSLRIKKQRMETALAAYGQAADYAVADVTTAATFEIAELYYRLSRDLLESERPAGLSPDEMEQYEILLEEQAFPFEEQAIEIFAANAGRTRDGVYDQWVRRSFTRLAELMPARYAKSERSENLVAQLD